RSASARISTDRARAVFNRAIKHRPRIRLTNRQRTCAPVAAAPTTITEPFCLFRHLPRVRAEHKTRLPIKALMAVSCRTKQAAQANRRSKVVLALGAAGLSLSLGSSASAAIGGMNGASSAPVSKQMHEEEISDVSLATFHVFDSENAGAHGQRARLAM